MPSLLPATVKVDVAYPTNFLWSRDINPNRLIRFHLDRTYAGNNGAPDPVRDWGAPTYICPRCPGA